MYAQGPKGETGESVKIVSVELTGGSEFMSTYTILFSDGTTQSFEVKNGADGKDGANGKDGTDGKDGVDGKDGADGEKGSAGESGNDGSTPFIGDNGNWWIGNTDTGIKADFSDKRDVTEGLNFAIKTVGGKSGVVVTSYEGSDDKIIIPNYVGTLPVIGIEETAFKGNRTIKSITLSSNTVCLPEHAFEGCSSLVQVDFNGAPIQEIPYAAFKNTSVIKVNLSKSVKILGEQSFSGSPVTKINLENVTRYAANCLDGFSGNAIYLSSSVSYVGKEAFSSTFIYIESSTAPTEWSDTIIKASSEQAQFVYKTHLDEDYVYSVNNGKAEVCAYLGDEKTVNIPNRINGYDVVGIGYGFGCIKSSLHEWFIAHPEEESIIPIRYFVPDSVTSINFQTFRNSGSLITVPETVSTVWLDTAQSDFPPYYAFEADEYPGFTHGATTPSPVLDKSDFLTQYAEELRLCNSVNIDNIVLDEEKLSFYEESGNGYTLLCVMDYGVTSLNISGVFNEKTVHTIRTDAVSCLKSLKNVRILGGISKITSYAFDAISLESIYLDGCVIYAEEYAMESISDSYLLEADSIPVDWSDRWAGIALNINVIYGCGI